MFWPGAAMPTHGPAIVNFDGWPSGVSEATDSTYGCHHDGTDTDVTPAQLRGSLGFPKSVSGLESHDAAPEPQPLEPLSPAAATMTASLLTAAYRIAAPSSPWSMLRSAGRQVIAEMSITRAPRSAACTIARASAAKSTAARCRGGWPPGGPDPGDPFAAGLAGDQPGDQRAVPVTVGEAIGRFDVIATGLYAG